MEIERRVEMIPLINQAEFEAKVAGLAAEGWRFVNEIPPVAVYHLVREVQQPTATMQISFGIDDSKVNILHPDGTIS